MKHTLNVLTLTALAAAASAQTAPATGLNYNQIGVSRAVRENTVSVQHTLGATNFVVGFETTSEGNSEPQISIGYIFKGVTNGIDATVSVTQAQWERTVYSVELRRALNEVYAGLEISAGYASTLSSNNEAYFGFGGLSANSESATSFEIAYNINSTFQVAVGLAQHSDGDRQTVYTVRAGF